MIALRTSVSKTVLGTLFFLSVCFLSHAQQRTFKSPEEATNELVKAFKAHDRQAVHEIFGPDVTNMMTGDKALDERHFEKFAARLEENCKSVPEGDHKVVLEIGKDNWSFPIPLVETNGAWMFDTAAGEEEIINRHIGRDEFYAIGVCRAYVKAQQEFFQRSGQQRYSEKFKSSRGKIDGLYQKETNGTASPFSAMVAEASQEEYHWTRGKGPHPFHGYIFKILTRQGEAAPGGKMNYIQHGVLTAGFALVAYPVRWGESGIMTFIVNQDGIVYQRTLGEKSSKIAASMKEYNPDGQWTVVQEPGITDFSEPSAQPGQ